MNVYDLPSMHVGDCAIASRTVWTSHPLHALEGILGLIRDGAVARDTEL